MLKYVLAGVENLKRPAIGYIDARNAPKLTVHRIAVVRQYAGRHIVGVRFSFLKKKHRCVLCSLKNAAPVLEVHLGCTSSAIVIFRLRGRTAIIRDTLAPRMERRLL